MTVPVLRASVPASSSWAVAAGRNSHPGPGGLIFGYAASSEQAIAEGIAILAGVIGR
jgi:DNA-binding transcriptional MocR family regulator